MHYHAQLPSAPPSSILSSSPPTSYCRYYLDRNVGTGW